MMTAQRRALKQRRNWILIALSVVVIFFVRWNYQPERVESEYFGMTDIAVIAHQGGNLLRPGNTLLAFDHAQSLGVDVLEMDIHASADGELVVIHDETLERTTNGQGLVKLQTLEQLKKLDAAYHWPFVDKYPDGQIPESYAGQGVTIPTLREVFERYPKQRMVIEIKQQEPSITQEFCSLLTQYNKLDHVVVASFSAEVIIEFRDACPRVATSAASSEVTWFVIYQTLGLPHLFAARAGVLQLPKAQMGFQLLDKSLIRDAQEQGLWVEYWTFNSVEDMAAGIAAGANGIMTDRPDVLLDELGRVY